MATIGPAARHRLQSLKVVLTCIEGMCQQSKRYTEFKKLPFFYSVRKFFCRGWSKLLLNKDKKYQEAGMTLISMVPDKGASR